METSQLHKALVSRAVKSYKDVQHIKAKNLWIRNNAISNQATHGWSYSWYTFVGDTSNPYYGDPQNSVIIYLDPSLHTEAIEHLEKESELNSLILSISLYVSKVLTVHDSCLSLAYPYFPPYLKHVFEEQHIPLDPAAKPIDLHLSEAEQKGKEELYALNLLEMTGT
jgi:hypothetical protein